MFQQSTEQIFNAFGVSGTYESEEDFTEREITILVDNRGVEFDEGSRIRIKTAEIRIQRSKVDNVQIDDMITFDNVQYQVSEILGYDAYEWWLSLSEDISA